MGVYGVGWKFAIGERSGLSCLGPANQCPPLNIAVLGSTRPLSPFVFPSRPVHLSGLASLVAARIEAYEYAARDQRSRLRSV